MSDLLNRHNHEIKTTLLYLIVDAEVASQMPDRVPKFNKCLNELIGVKSL